MAKKWKLFEKECVKYLNDTYSMYASFTQEGGSDSNKPDIIATTKSGMKLIIEVKSRAAQGFQFTLLPDDETRSFRYTGRLKESSATKRIKSYMEQFYDKYKNVDKTGIPVNMETGVFFEHVKNYSQQKQIDFFISKYQKKYIIAPTERFDAYFSISANYRIKTSGPGHPGKKYKTDINTQLAALIDCDYILHMGSSKKKTFVETSYNLDQLYLYGELATYFCAKETDNKYYIKKRSKTENPNVIFQIKSNREQQPEDLSAFITKLET